VLLNPYNVRLYAEVLSFSRNPNLNRLIEWQMLSLSTVQGSIAAGTALALVVVFWISPRRSPAGEILALLALGAAALWSARMLTGWAPVAAHSFAIHADSAWRRFRPAGTSAAAPPRSGFWTTATAAIAVLVFSTTPFGLQLLTGCVPDLEQSVSP